MIKPIQAMLRILQGKVILSDGTDVRIVKRDYPMDKTPCITIDNSGGTATIQKNVTNMEYTVPSSHPQYDPNNPSQKISQQVIREENNITLNLSIWCDNEDEREEITRKISQLFKMVQSDHYTYCSQYNNGNCNKLQRACCAINSNSFRGVKNQCPKPDDYGYQNVFTAFDIIRPTFDVTPAYDEDDLTANPIVLRSIIRVSFSYYDYYNIGGAVIKSISINEELL